MPSTISASGVVLSDHGLFPGAALRRLLCPQPKHAYAVSCDREFTVHDAARNATTNGTRI